MKTKILPMAEYMVAHTWIESQGESFEVVTQVSQSTRDLEVPQYYWQMETELPYESLVFMLTDKLPERLPKELEGLLRVGEGMYRDFRLSDVFSKHYKTIEEAAMGHDDILDALHRDALPVAEPEERLAVMGLHQI